MATRWLAYGLLASIENESCTLAFMPGGVVLFLDIRVFETPESATSVISTIGSVAVLVGVLQQISNVTKLCLRSELLIRINNNRHILVYFLRRRSIHCRSQLVYHIQLFQQTNSSRDGLHNSDKLPQHRRCLEQEWCCAYY